jgi:hypothetical protein
VCCTDADKDCNREELFVSFVEGFKREQYVFSQNLIFGVGEADSLLLKSTAMPTEVPLASTISTSFSLDSYQPTGIPISLSPTNTGSLSPSTSPAIVQETPTSSPLSFITAEIPTDASRTLAPSSAPVAIESVKLRSFVVDITVDGVLDENMFVTAMKSYLTEQMGNVFNNFLHLSLQVAAPRDAEGRHLQQTIVFVPFAGTAHFAGTAPDESVVFSTQTQALEKATRVQKAVVDNSSVGTNVIVENIEFVNPESSKPTSAPTVSMKRQPTAISTSAALPRCVAIGWVTLAIAIKMQLL